MEIDFLRHFKFPESLLELLRAEYGENLLPLQERAIREGGLFDGNNLLVCAPTSSGKTFLAELLFLYHASQGRNAVLMVPTKALANQRYEQLLERYKSIGYEILLSTRDRPFHDRRILEGRFHLAIVIYEKMRALLAQNSAFAASLGACIADEFHYLFDANRGPDIEMLLTRLRKEENLQLLGLSAMVSDPAVARWLNARPIVESKRPVELRQGVLCRGEYFYREFNSTHEGRERFFCSETTDEGEAMLEAAEYFAQNGETTLLFWPQRNLCYTAARKLAARCETEEFLEIPELEQLEATAMRDFLAQLLPRRIAVHTSDLSPKERALVERLARSGEVILICATSTLAEGVNFPVNNVLTTRRMYTTRPQDAEQGLPPSAQPISHDRLYNMIGRAGRLGYTSFGRGIVITTSPGDVEGLIFHYMRCETPSFIPILNRTPFNQVILKSMGYSGSFTLESCCNTLLDTLSGQMNLMPPNLSELVEKTCEGLEEAGYLSRELERYYPTPLGELVMKNGLFEQSAKRISDFIQKQMREGLNQVDLFVFICSLQEMGNVYVNVPRNEIRSHTWSQAVMQLADDLGTSENAYVKQLLKKPERLRPEHHAALKKSLLLNDWINGLELTSIEKRYGLFAGSIQHLVEDASWLLGCLAEASASFALESNCINQLFQLKDQTLYGLPADGLEWTKYLQKQILSRSQILHFLESGYKKPSALCNEDREFVLTFLPPDVADILCHTDHGAFTEPTSERYVIELEERRSDRMRLNGDTIPLTPLQSRMIQALSKRTGFCAPYKELIEEMWPDSIGDKKQIFRHKTLLLKKAEKITDKSVSDLIETVAGEGLILHAQIHRIA